MRAHWFALESVGSPKDLGGIIKEYVLYFRNITLVHAPGYFNGFDCPSKLRHLICSNKMQSNRP